MSRFAGRDTEPFCTTITVVDNASTDGTAARVRNGYASVQVIEARRQSRICKANNIGIRATKSDYVVILNPDTVTPPGGDARHWCAVSPRTRMRRSPAPAC